MAKAMYVGVKPNLPDGYTQIEYIESTGTQYINADYMPDYYSTVLMEFSTTTPNTPIFGCETGSTHYVFTSSGYRLYNASSTNRNYYDGNKHIVRFGVGSIYVDGAQILSTSGTHSFSKDLFLLANNGANATEYSSNVKVYYCKIYNNVGRLVRDYIPATNALGLKGLYDLVEGTFRMNPNFDAFLAGNETDGVAKNITNAYIGIGGKARKVKKAYIGDENGKARLFFSRG